VLQLERYANLPAFADASMDTVEAILEEAGKFTGRGAGALNGVGDKEGCTWSPDFTVKTPTGFKAPTEQLVAAAGRRWGPIRRTAARACRTWSTSPSRRCRRRPTWPSPCTRA
jgi:hypothetical protein